MIQRAHDGTPLPPGISYEVDRARYRVRVRRHNRIVHQTRHPPTDQGLVEAWASLREGRKKRNYITKRENSVGPSDSERARALAEGLI